MVNFSNLVDLSTHEDEVPAELTNPALAAAVKKAMEKHREEKESASADEVLEALRMVESSKGAARREVKRLRAQMKVQTDKLDEIDLALAYGQTTSNFLPLLVTLGAVSPYHSSSYGLEPAEFEKFSKVPKGWKPPTPAAS